VGSKKSITTRFGITLKEAKADKPRSDNGENTDCCGKKGRSARRSCRQLHESNYYADRGRSGAGAWPHVVEHVVGPIRWRVMEVGDGGDGE